MTKEFDDVKAALDAIKAAVAGAVADIQALAARVSGADSPAAIEAVAQDMQSVASGLDAVVNPPAPTGSTGSTGATGSTGGTGGTGV